MDLWIVNYCSPLCQALHSITRLPEDEAHAKAKELAGNKGTAFYRFADFQNYYPRRMKTEQWLYEHFLKLGGDPATAHPLYFVLQGSDYLDEWFGKGKITRLPLGEISTKHISFTFGDSCAKMDRPERRDPFTKEALYDMIAAHGGPVEDFLREIGEKWRYIEAQLWDDRYCLQAGPEGSR